MLRTLLPAIAGLVVGLPAAARAEPAADATSESAPAKTEAAPAAKVEPAPAAKVEPAPAAKVATAPATEPTTEPATATEPEPPKKRRWGAKQGDRMAKPKDGRSWMIGLEGVILQAPPLRSRVVYIDPRFVGRSIAMGGGGVFARYRPIQFIGFDIGARTGSVRYRGQDSDTVVSQDQVLFDAGLLLFLGRGDVAQFALSGGLGGQYSRIGYDLESGLRGKQVFGSMLFRLGAEAEFLVKRVAFVLSFRTYGVLTDRDSVSNKGELLKGDMGERALAPVPTYQTYLLGSAGIAFRF